METNPPGQTTILTVGGTATMTLKMLWFANIVTNGAADAVLTIRKDDGSGAIMGTPKCPAAALSKELIFTKPLGRPSNSDIFLTLTGAGAVAYIHHD